MVVNSKFVATRSQPTLVNVTGAVYEDSEKTLVNFPVSVMNGVTSEGGLVSLTFKSITCADLVENLDVMKAALVPGLSRETRLRNDDVDFGARIARLQSEIAAMKEQAVPEAKIDITGPVEAIREEQYVAVDTKGYLQTTIDEGIQVDKFEDVKNIDLTPYQREDTLVSAPETATVKTATGVAQSTPAPVAPVEIVPVDEGSQQN